MLGRTLSGPEGTEGDGSRTLRGLGLLPIDTVFEAKKTSTRMRGTVIAAPFAAVRVDAYEIHAGRTAVDGEAFCRLDNGQCFGDFVKRS